MAAYNSNFGQMPFGKAMPVPDRQEDGWPQTGGLRRENLLPGYANYNSAEPQYTGQWNTGSSEYQQQGARQTPVGYNTSYHQRMNEATGGLDYESTGTRGCNIQGYPHGGQGYQGQTFDAAGNQAAGPGAWDPNQSRWSGPTGGGAGQGQGGFGQGDGPGFGFGYKRGGGPERGRGYFFERGGGRGAPPGRFMEGQGRGRTFGNCGQEFESDGGCPRGSGTTGGGRGKPGRRGRDISGRGIGSLTSGWSVGKSSERDIQGGGRSNKLEQGYWESGNRINGSDRRGVSDDTDEGTGYSVWQGSAVTPGGGDTWRTKTFMAHGTGVGNLPSEDVIGDSESQEFTEPDGLTCLSTDSLYKSVELWQIFAQTFRYCGNPITTMDASIIASKVQVIELNYTSRLLTKYDPCFVFTGCLYIKKVSDTEDGVFLARGLGLNKKSVKLDTYQKAYNLVMHSTIDALMSQEDTNDEALIVEVNAQFTSNPNSFWALLKNGKGEGKYVKGTQAVINASKERPASVSSSPNFPPKRARMSSEPASMLEASSTSMVPKKQTEIVMSPSDSLFDKLTKLKKLLKEEGITKLHIVPKIDQLGNKSALSIRNVYRFAQQAPLDGDEDEKPVFCEIYFDNVLMSRGDVSVKYAAAMHNAYTLFAKRLCTEPLDSILHSSCHWEEYMKSDPNFCQVIVKKDGEYDSVLTNNLVSIKQMMQTKPDMSKSIAQFVLMDFESEASEGRHYKMLEMSANHNCMLLECEIVRSEEQRFTCIMSIQGRQLAIRTASSKQSAKKMCAEALFNRLKETSDIVFVGKELKTPICTKKQLLGAAINAKEAGVEPLKCNLKIKEVKFPASMTGGEEVRMIKEKNIIKNNGDEGKNAYIPWMAKALADFLLDHYSQVTLEDVQIETYYMSSFMRDMVSIVSSRFELHTIKPKNAEKFIIRHKIAPIDITKILGMNNGESGRYKLKQCKNPWSAKELEDYKNETIDKYTKMYEDLLNDTDPDSELEIEFKRA